MPCGPVSKGRGSCSASVCHSTCWHSWFPQWTVAPQCRQNSCSPRLMQPGSTDAAPGLSCASFLEEAFFWDNSHADQFDAVCGVWSEHWQADPHPFKLCSDAGNTHMSISQTQPLDMMLSTSTQLLWSTMARPVLSGTCPVKPLFGLGHCAAAQFQGPW